MRSIPSLRRLALVLFACVLALRLAIAPGLMPAASSEGLQLTLCSGKMLDAVGTVPKTRPACPFVALATAADVATPPFVGGERTLRCAAPHAASPLIASVVSPRACRPPGTGPPRTA